MPVSSRSPRVLTGEECRRIIGRFKDTFNRHRIDITQHPLGEDLVEIAWLANIRGDVFADGSPAWQDQPRATRSLRKVLLTERRSRALEKCSEFPGFRQVVKHLKNLRTDAAYSASDASDQAWDRLYEVEIAARLAHMPVSISFAEPDVLATDSSGELVVLACKRPRERRTVERALLKGFEQLHHHETMGFVAINADLLLNPIATARDAEPLVPECQHRLEEIGEVCAEARRRLDDQPHPTPEVRRGVLGVIVTATFGLSGVDSSSRGSYVNTRFLVDAWPHPRLDSLATVPAVFQDFLLAGEASLIGDPNDDRS